MRYSERIPRKALRRLADLSNAQRISNLRIPPSYRLGSLKEGDAYGAEFTDYH